MTTQTTIEEYLNAIRSKLELEEQSNSEALEHLAAIESKLNAPMKSAEDDFEDAVIDLLGPSALAGDKMSIYDAAKLMYFRARQDALAHAAPAVTEDAQERGAYARGRLDMCDAACDVVLGQATIENDAQGIADKIRELIENDPTT